MTATIGVRTMARDGGYDPAWIIRLSGNLEGQITALWETCELKGSAVATRKWIGKTD